MVFFPANPRMSYNCLGQYKFMSEFLWDGEGWQVILLRANDHCILFRGGGVSMHGGNNCCKTLVTSQNEPIPISETYRAVYIFKRPSRDIFLLKYPLCWVFAIPPTHQFGNFPPSIIIWVDVGGPKKYSIFLTKYCCNAMGWNWLLPAPMKKLLLTKATTCNSRSMLNNSKSWCLVWLVSPLQDHINMVEPWQIPVLFSSCPQIAQNSVPWESPLLNLEV